MPHQYWRNWVMDTLGSRVVLVKLSTLHFPVDCSVCEEWTSQHDYCEVVNTLQKKAGVVAGIVLTGAEFLTVPSQVAPLTPYF
jgi:hypothetical protein